MRNTSQAFSMNLSIQLSELLRFAVVGVAATLVHFTVLTIGVELFGIPSVPMNGLAFCTAVFVTYFGQSLWVFRRPDISVARFFRFGTSIIGGLLGNVGMMALAVEILSLPYQIGFVLSVAVVSCATFLLNKFWVFGK